MTLHPTVSASTTSASTKLAIVASKRSQITLIAAGLGRAVIEGSGELRGRIFFHQGDDSAFTATREDSSR